MTRLIAVFDETERGDVEFSVHGQGSKPTQKEQDYLSAMLEAIKEAMPGIAKRMNCKGMIVIPTGTKESNQ